MLNSKSIKYCIVSLVVLFSTMNISAQPSQTSQGVVRGKVVDSETSSPLINASVSLLRQRDSTAVTGAISDKSGSFEIDDVPRGRYIVKVNYIGYEQKFVNDIQIGPDSKEFDLGSISLRQGAASMDEVKITAEKPMIEYSAGKKIVNVDKNIIASGGNALDVLKNIPSLNVDIEGNITLRGSSNFNVLINGKPSTLMASPSIILEQIPASMIENVEIITNPSAKYEAEGTTGIINIVLKQEKDPGLNGLVSANAGSYNRYNASVSLNYKLESFNLFGNYDFANFNGGMDGVTYRETYSTDTNTTLDQNMNRRRGSKSHNVRGGFDYAFNKFNSIQFSTAYRFNNSDFSGSTGSSTVPDPGVPFQSMRNNTEQSTRPNLDLSLNYKLKFENKGQELSADAYYSAMNDDEFADYIEYVQGIPVDDIYQKSDNYEKNKSFVLQSDYVHPFGKFTKLETGVKGTSKKLDNDYIYYNSYDTGNSWILDTNVSNRFIYDEQVYSVYGIFSSSIEDFGYSVGLRVEQSDIKGEQRTTSQSNEKNYIDFFPSTSLSYKFNNMQELQFNYSRRINRPRGEQLNPFIDYSNQYTWRYGNPDLDPEYTESTELGFIQSFDKHTFTPAFFYKYTDQVIDRYTEVIGTGLMGMTYKNTSISHSYGFELSYAGEIAKWFRLNGDISYFKQEVYGIGEYSGTYNNNYSWSSRFNATFIPIKSLNFQLSGFYNAPTVNIQGQRDAFYSFDLGGRYDILDNLAVILRVTDIFDTMKFHNISSGEDFYVDFTMKRQSQAISFGIQYKINEGMKQRDRKRPSDDNGGGFDDF